MKTIGQGCSCPMLGIVQGGIDQEVPFSYNIDDITVHYKELGLVKVGYWS